VTRAVLSSHRHLQAICLLHVCYVLRKRPSTLKPSVGQQLVCRAIQDRTTAAPFCEQLSAKHMLQWRSSGHNSSWQAEANKPAIQAQLQAARIGTFRSRKEEELVCGRSVAIDATKSRLTGSQYGVEASSRIDSNASYTTFDSTMNRMKPFRVGLNCSQFVRQQSLRGSGACKVSAQRAALSRRRWQQQVQDAAKGRQHTDAVEYLLGGMQGNVQGASGKDAPAAAALAPWPCPP
jgi:hypothetical protein